MAHAPLTNSYITQKIIAFRPTALIVVGLLIVCVSHASAQPRAFVSPLVQVFDLPPSLIEFDLATRQVLAVNGTDGGHFPSNKLAVSSDGRYVVWATSTQTAPAVFTLFARNVLTQQIVSAPLDEMPIKIVAHPRSLAFFLVNFRSLVILSPTLRRQMTTCLGTTDASLTLDGVQLFLACGDRVVVIDTIALTVAREIPLPERADFIQVNDDGTRFATSRQPTAENDQGVGLYDSISGTRLARVSVRQPASGETASTTALASNATRTVLYAGFQTVWSTPRLGESGETYVYQFNTLNLRATIPTPLRSVAVTPDGTQAVATWGGLRNCRVYLLNPTTNVIEQESPFFTGCQPTAVVATPPLPPTTLTANVANRRVTFSWQLLPHSPAVTEYVVEVRLQSNGPIVASFPLTTTTFTVDAVPPGAYFLSVRASNALGTSQSSTVQRVDIP